MAVSLKPSLFSAMVLAGILAIGFSVHSSAVDRWIVVFEPQAANEEAQDGIIKGVGGTVIKDLPLISGKAVLLPEKAVNALGKKAGITRVEADIILSISPAPNNNKDKDNPSTQPFQSLPWGIDRIDGEVSLGIYNATGAGVKVAIIDTGIDTSHPDLAVAGGINTTIGRKSKYTDDHGHGTHVAGTIAALNNGIGVVGVAPSASLYSVKAFRSDGSGYISDTIEGIDWCIKNRINVINMSFRSTINSQALHDAVIKAANAGIIQVAAAGNDAGSVGYPAAYPETIAVSAVGKDDAFASFSNYGPEVDYAAPGIEILSTVPGGNYSSWSGTSMATPHVTGVVAIALQKGWKGLKAEWLDKLTTEQQGNGIIDAEGTINDGATNLGNNYSGISLAPGHNPEKSMKKLATSWANIRTL